MSNKVDVLVVDDEESIREVIEEFAVMKGFSCATAENGIIALEKFKIHDPALIISDISMPGMSGLEFLEKVRIDGLSAAVVMLTAHDDSVRIIEALRLGAIDYLTKPFDADELLGKLGSWIELGSRLKELRTENAENTRGDTSKQLRMIELFQLKNKKLSA